MISLLRESEGLAAVRVITLFFNLRHYSLYGIYRGVPVYSLLLKNSPTTMQPVSTFLYRTPESPRKHRHDHAQLVVGIEGLSRITVEGEEMIVDKMLGCIIPSQTYHVFAGIGDNRNLTVNFNLRYAGDLAKRICEQPRVFELDRSIQTFLQFAALELPEFNGSANIGHDSFCQHVIAVLTSLLNAKIFNPHDNSKRISIARIDEYIERRLRKKIPVNELARESRISSSHFYTLFLQETGMTPHRYINEKRLEKAMFMLCSTSLSISEISYETGFCSQSAFSNSFKKRYGQPPGRMRRETT